MNRNQRYMIALANTEHDAPLLRYASQLARLHLGREFRFVHVTRSGAHAGEVHALPQEDEATVRLAGEVERHFGTPPEGVVTSCHLLGGERVDALLEFATRSRSDVIMLGHRHERSGQRSLARRMAMLSPSSVWLVPEGAPGEIRRVLAPVDFSDHSADALAVAASLASAVHAERCLGLHVYFDDTLLPTPEHVATVRAGKEAAFHQFLARANTPGFKVETRLEEGPFPSRTILRVAREEAADLIVMNTRGRSRAAAVLLGSVTTQVMVESPVAILAVKHFGAAMGLFQVLKEHQFWQPPPPRSN